MPDRDGVLAHQNLLRQQPKDLLTFCNIESVSPRPNPSAEISEAVNQAQVLVLVGGGRLQRLQLRLDGLLLLAQFRDAMAQLVQAEQVFLIRRDQALHSVRQSGLLSLQAVNSPSKGIRISGGFQPAVQFGLDQAGIFQQPDDLRPDSCVEIVLADRAAVTESTFQMPIGIRTQAAVVVDLVAGRSELRSGRAHSRNCSQTSIPCSKVGSMVRRGE